MVALRIHYDATGRVFLVEPTETYASKAATDSIVRLARGWIVPQDPFHNLSHELFAVIPLDRTAAWARHPVQRLPANVSEALRQDAFLCWQKAITAIDSAFSLNDFTTVGSRSMFSYRDTLFRKDAGPPESGRMRQHGMCLPSPGGDWVLEPLVGLAVDSLGHVLGRDAETSCRVWQTSGDLLYEEGFGVEGAVDRGQWISDHEFVLVGTDAVPLCGVSARGAVIWLGDVRAGTITIFYGCPVPPLVLSSLLDGLLRCLQQAYPGLIWEP